MASFRNICFVIAMASGVSFPLQTKADGNHQGHGSRKGEVMPAAAKLPNKNRKAPRLPRLPAGVTELKFNDFFVTPVGPRGLEISQKLKELDGKRVRILGYMVRQEHGTPGCFMLSPLPVDVHEHDNAMADDLPASVLYVSSPAHAGNPVPFAPGLLLVTGTLSVGSAEESNGRISLVRLKMDPVLPKASIFGKGAPNFFKNSPAFPRRESR